MARPRLSDTEKKLESFRVRVRRDERLRIRSYAQALNLSLSRYVLLCCDKAQKSPFVSSRYAPKERRALLGMANNLNQITKHMHITGQVESDALDEVLTQIKQALSE